MWHFFEVGNNRQAGNVPANNKAQARPAAPLFAGNGEEVMVDNTDRAIAIASEKMNVVVNDYTAAPIYFSESNNGSHEWLIEFENDPANIQEFAYELDCALKTLNSDYEAKRHKDIALKLPLVKALPKNTFNKWLHSKGKLGGQHKVPRLSNERVIVEEILAVITTK